MGDVHRGRLRLDWSAASAAYAIQAQAAAVDRQRLREVARCWSRWKLSLKERLGWRWRLRVRVRVRLMLGSVGLVLGGLMLDLGWGLRSGLGLRLGLWDGHRLGRQEGLRWMVRLGREERQGREEGLGRKEGLRLGLAEGWSLGWC